MNKTKSVYDFEFHPNYNWRGYCETNSPREIGINLAKHESIEEIYATLLHEGLHSCFFHNRIYLSDKKEHILIQKVMWTNFYV